MAVAEERVIKLREFWKHLVGKKKGFLELIMYENIGEVGMLWIILE